MTYMLRNGFDPMKGEKISQVWTGILQVLEDGKSHSWSEVIGTVLQSVNVQAKTVSNLIHDGVNAGYFARTGNYTDGTRSVIQIRWED